MDPDLFLRLAERLAQYAATDPIVRAAFRTAMSRSYYAPFNAGIRLLGKMRVEIDKKEDVHRTLRNAFLFSGHDLAKEIGVLLRKLLEERRRADYDLEDVGPESKKKRRKRIARFWRGNEKDSRSTAWAGAGKNSQRDQELCAKARFKSAGNLLMKVKPICEFAVLLSTTLCP